MGVPLGLCLGPGPGPTQTSILGFETATDIPNNNSNLKTAAAARTEGDSPGGVARHGKGSVTVPCRSGFSSIGPSSDEERAGDGPDYTGTEDFAGRSHFSRILLLAHRYYVSALGYPLRTFRSRLVPRPVRALLRSTAHAETFRGQACLADRQHGCPEKLCEAITGRYGSAIGHWDRARRQHRMNVESHLRQHFGEPNNEVLRQQPCGTVARMRYVALRCICSG